MKAHKTQLTIILALTVVLFILIGATAIQARTAITRPSVPVIADADKPAEEEPTAPTAGYSLTRTARLSLVDAEIENNYGGSGNETLVSAIAANERLYVFFNTDSTDCDSSGIDESAITELDRDLNIKNVFRTSGKIEAAILGEGGFVIAASVDGTTAVNVINYDGEITASTLVPRAGEITQLFLTDDGYIIVSKTQSGTLGKTAIHLCSLAFDLSLKYERTITAGYSLDPVAAFTRGAETFVFFNAGSDLGNHIGVAKCTAASETLITYLSRFENHSASAVVPYSSGWAIGTENGVIVTDGAAVILRTLECSPLPRLYYADGLYYAFSGGATSFDEALTKRFDLDYFSDKGEITDCVAGSGYGVFLGKTDSALTVTASENRLGLMLHGKFGRSRLVRLNNDWFVVAEATEKSADVGLVYGGSDIWVARLKI